MPLLDATLTIADGDGGTYVYNNAKFAKSQLESRVQLTNDGRTEKDGFTVDLRSASFMGATSPITIDGGWFGNPFQPRATVELGGETVFEGRISKADVASDPEDAEQAREWTVTVQGFAFADVLDELSTTSVFDDEILDSFDSYKEFPTRWTDEEGTRQGPQDLRWYDIVELWRTAVEAIGPFVFETTIDLFPLEVDYENSNGNQDTYYRAQRPFICSLQAAEFDDEGQALVEHTLPDWTCEDLYKFLRNVTGFRLRADYDPFPSETVRLVEIEGEYNPEGPALPYPTNFKKDDRYDLSTRRPEKKDFALWLEGHTLGDTKAPPDVATYAAFRRRVNTEGEPNNENVRELDMRAPKYEARTKNSFSDGDFSERYTAGEPHIDTEHNFWAAVTQGNPTELRARDSGSGGKPDVYSEVWLNEHYWRHALVAAPLHEVTGTFDISDLPPLKVGEIDSGFRLEGKDWIVRSIRRNEDKEVAQIIGVCPTNEYSPGRLVGSVLGSPQDVLLLGGTEDTDRDGEIDRYALRATWERGTERGIHPADYQWEIYDDNAALIADGTTTNMNSGWEDVTETEYNSASYARVRGRYTRAPEWESYWSYSPGGGIDQRYED